MPNVPKTRLCLMRHPGEWNIERRTMENPPSAALLGWLERPAVPRVPWEFRPVAVPDAAKATQEELVQIEGWRRQFNAGALVTGIEPHGVCSRCDKAQKRKPDSAGDGRVKCTECGATLTRLLA
jgi:hypothetical protein